MNPNDWSVLFKITPVEGEKTVVKYLSKYFTLSSERPPLPRKGDNKSDIEQVILSFLSLL